MARSNWKFFPRVSYCSTGWLFLFGKESTRTNPLRVVCGASRAQRGRKSSCDFVDHSRFDLIGGVLLVEGIDGRNNVIDFLIETGMIVSRDGFWVDYKLQLRGVRWVLARQRMRRMYTVVFMIYKLQPKSNDRFLLQPKSIEYMHGIIWRWYGIIKMTNMGSFGGCWLTLS